LLCSLTVIALAGLAGSLGAASSRGFSLGAPVAAPLSVEETRYLGGDLEHTHLVKGLDFALLQKVRSEQQSHAGERPEAMPAGDAAAAVPTVRTSIGRAVHAFITGSC
jgi:IK cytokine